MALVAEDQARLRRIESDLASTDPALARRFRSWRPPAHQPVTLPGWSAMPRWVMEVFLVGCAGWMLPPALCAVVVAGIAACRLWSHTADRPCPPQQRAAPGGGRRRPPGRRRQD
ncbi:MAG: hypothetical protein QOK35_1765 [Pseudonocardiales bacterium]|nr:hypothetical protein [Pseudonocardiales bacterium]